ncbi:MAG: alkylmercury lyase [Actinophytocola sp.]|uniref:alkylmercury lyase n=1 Tax=Actinophytocola sp. TaxID=1872138 RepID=UPI001324F75E|nr:alkylmercury lyase [Actinophytocola sp.]MPZ85715.1 alkylmercury lyase [Actinophytocola sp.]
MTLIVELWHVPDCPLIDRVRATLRECLRHTGIDVPVRERQGPYPSPTLIINGIDVATGTTPSDSMCCRLDLPTHDQIHAALTDSSRP